MLEHRTPLVATSISGNSLSQTRVRAILPILVRQAMAPKRFTIRNTLGITVIENIQVQ